MPLLSRSDCCQAQNPIQGCHCTIPLNAPHGPDHECWTAWGHWSGDPGTQRLHSKWSVKPTAPAAASIAPATQNVATTEDLCCRDTSPNGYLCTIPNAVGYHFIHESCGPWGMWSGNGGVAKKKWINSTPPPDSFVISKHKCCSSSHPFRAGLLCTIPIVTGYHSICEAGRKMGRWSGNGSDLLSRWNNLRDKSYYELKPEPPPPPVFEPETGLTEWDLLDDADGNLPTLEEMYAKKG